MYTPPHTRMEDIECLTSPRHGHVLETAPDFSMRVMLRYALGVALYSSKRPVEKRDDSFLVLVRLVENPGQMRVFPRILDRSRLELGAIIDDPRLDVRPCRLGVVDALVDGLEGDRSIARRTEDVVRLCRVHLAGHFVRRVRDHRVGVV